MAALGDGQQRRQLTTGTIMSRRAGAAVDRHALLSGGAYPSSSYRNGGIGGGGGGGVAGTSSSTQAAGIGGAGLESYRNVSPFEQPYAHTPSNPYAEYGAPKKEPTLYGGGGATAAAAGLLGNRSTTMTNGSSLGNLFGLRTAEQLEEQNDEHLEGLSAKVRVLRDITVGIGNEVRDSTKDLDSLSEAFNSASAFLGNTFTRMNHMARRQGGWFCNMMLFLLFVIWIFVFLWWWRR